MVVPAGRVSPPDATASPGQPAGAAARLPLPGHRLYADGRSPRSRAEHPEMESETLRRTPRHVESDARGFGRRNSVNSVEPHPRPARRGSLAKEIENIIGKI